MSSPPIIVSYFSAAPISSLMCFIVLALYPNHDLRPRICGDSALETFTSDLPFKASLQTFVSNLAFKPSFKASLQTFSSNLPFKPSFQTFPSNSPFKPSLRTAPSRIPLQTSLQTHRSNLPFELPFQTYPSNLCRAAHPKSREGFNQNTPLKPSLTPFPFRC